MNPINFRQMRLGHWLAIFGILLAAWLAGYDLAIGRYATIPAYVVYVALNVGCWIVASWPLNGEPKRHYVEVSDKKMNERGQACYLIAPLDEMSWEDVDTIAKGVRFRFDQYIRNNRLH